MNALRRAGPGSAPSSPCSRVRAVNFVGAVAPAAETVVVVGAFALSAFAHIRVGTTHQAGPAPYNSPSNGHHSHSSSTTLAGS
jgi:hypothetical protein